MTNGMISILPLSTSNMYVATSHYHLHMAYISLKWFDMQEFLSRVRLLRNKLMLQGFLQSCWISAFRKFYDCYNDLIIYDYKLSLNHCLTFFIPIVIPYLAHWLWQRITAFSIMELGSRRVWPVDRGCLFLLSTWSHLRYIRRSVLAHFFLTCNSYLFRDWSIYGILAISLQWYFEMQVYSLRMHVHVYSIRIKINIFSFHLLLDQGYACTYDR
jgi:hypothetical protein